MLSCKDMNSLQKKYFTNEIRLKSECKDRGGKGEQHYLHIIKMENFHQNLMMSLTWHLFPIT